MQVLCHLAKHAVYPDCSECGTKGERIVIADLIARYRSDADRDEILARCRCSACGWSGRPAISLVWLGRRSYPNGLEFWPRSRHSLGKAGRGRPGAVRF